MNNKIILLIIAILPVYIIGLYVYKKDKDKESRKLLSKLFASGIISCIPAIILELIISSLFVSEKNMDLITLLFYVFIGIAFIEEICKWIFVYKISYNHQEFDHIYDAIVYAVFVSLGFAAFENIFYVLDSGITTGLIRAISSIPGHACDAIIMGNYLGLAKIAEVNNNKKAAKKNLYLSIIMPTIAHGIYDYCLFTENMFFVIIFLIFIAYIYIYAVKKIKKLSSVKNNFTNINTNKVIIGNYCPKCGKEGTGKYCTNCGENLVLNNSNNLTHKM